MKKKLLNISFISIGLLSGCTATTVDEFARKYSPDNVKRMAVRSLSSDSSEKFISNFGDEVLSKKFSDYYDKEGYSFDYAPNRFNIRKQVVYFSNNVYMSRANSYVEQLPVENEFTKKYKEAIVQKGNSYRVLTGQFNKKLIELIIGKKVPDFDSNSKKFFKWDVIPAIAEFDKSSQLISLMMGNYTIEAAFGQPNNPNVQSEILQNVLVYRSSFLNKVRMNITDAMWKENTIN